MFLELTNITQIYSITGWFTRIYNSINLKTGTKFGFFYIKLEKGYKKFRHLYGNTYKVRRINDGGFGYTAILTLLLLGILLNICCSSTRIRTDVFSLDRNPYILPYSKSSLGVYSSLLPLKKRYSITSYLIHGISMWNNIENNNAQTNVFILIWFREHHAMPNS